MNRRDLFKAAAGAAAACVLPAVTAIAEQPESGPLCTRITCKRINPHLWDVTIDFGDHSFFTCTTGIDPEPKEIMRLVGKPVASFIPYFQQCHKEKVSSA